MFDLTSLDYVYIGVVLASTVWATIRGGVYETVATISWIAAAVAARFVSPALDGLFQNWFKLSESSIGTLLSSYFLVFFVILVIFGIFNQKLRDKIQESVIKVTDHTLGVIFGIARGIIIMGLVYWAALWYYSDSSELPGWVSNARTKPVMQMTAMKIKNWFIPGENKLLERDIDGTQENLEIFNNLINPAVKATPVKIKPDTTDSKTNPGVKITSDKKTDITVKSGDKKTDSKISDKNTIAPVVVPDTGYKSSERTALENQLLQIETAAKAENKKSDK